MVTAHRGDGRNDLGTLARGTVIPGNGNILTLIHPRGHSALVSEIGNVLRLDVTQAALSLCVQRPPARREASRLFLSRYTGSCCTVTQGWWEGCWQRGPEEIGWVLGAVILRLILNPSERREGGSLHKSAEKFPRTCLPNG